MLTVLFTLFATLTGCASTDEDTSEHHHHHHGGTEIPEDANFSTEAVTEGETWTLRYETRPETIELSENFALTVSVSDGNGPAADVDLDIDATMPAHNHGMNTAATVTANGDGSFTVEGMQFHMTGHWRIHANVQTADQPEEYAWFDVTCCD